MHTHYTAIYNATKQELATYYKRNTIQKRGIPGKIPWQLHGLVAWLQSMHDSAPRFLSLSQYSFKSSPSQDICHQ